MAQAVSVYVTMQNGGRYRVAFDTQGGRVLLVARQPKVPGGREVAVDIDGPKGVAVVDLARPKYKAMIGATSGKRGRG